jgi:hypothetical protein
MISQDIINTYIVHCDVYVVHGEKEYPSTWEFRGWNLVWENSF